MSLTNNFFQPNHKIDENMRDVVYFTTIFFIIGINLLISLFVRSNSFLFFSNKSPIGFSFGYYSSVLILMIVTWAVLHFKLLLKSPVFTMLILAGIYSNFIEKLIWNAVADYINLWNINFNLADIQIFLGIILINFQAWFDKSSPAKKATTPVEN